MFTKLLHFFIFSIMIKDNYFSVSVNISFSAYKVILHISKMLMLKFQLAII